MPTLKELQEDVLNKKAAFDSAVENKNSAQHNMSIAFEYLRNCKTDSLISDDMLGNPVTRNICGNYAKVLNPAKKYPGCATIGSCYSRVDEYNDSVNNFLTVKSDVQGKEDLYNTAVTNLKDFSGTTPEILDSIEGGKRKKIITISIIFLLFLVVGFFVYKKFIKKK